jgi:hypothetical protein
MKPPSSCQGNALELHGARVHQPLGISSGYEGQPTPSGGPPRLFPASSNQSVVDLETRTVHPRGPLQWTPAVGSR